MIKLAIKCNLQKLNGLSFHRLFVPFSKISDSIEFKCDVFPDLDILLWYPSLYEINVL